MDALEIAAATQLIQGQRSASVEPTALVYGEAKALLGGLDLHRINRAVHQAAARFHGPVDTTELARAVLASHEFDGSLEALSRLRDGVRAALLPSAISSPSCAAPNRPVAGSAATPSDGVRRYSELSESERDTIVAQAFRAMDDFIGMDDAKAFVHSFERKLKQDRRRREAASAVGRDPNARSTPISRNMIVLGDSGVGKTDFIRRVVAPLLFAYGVVETDVFIETNFSQMDGGAWGKARQAANEACEKATGGVLYLDEAHQLFKGKAKSDEAGEQASPFGQEVIETLIPWAENERGGSVLILSGYTKPMLRMLEADEGMAERIKTKMVFPSYALDQLTQMAMESFPPRYGEFRIDPEARDAVEAAIRARRDQPHFAQARSVRNLVEDWIDNLDDRVGALGDSEITDEMLFTIRREDIKPRPGSQLPRLEDLV